MTRAWKLVMMGSRSTPPIAAWQKYDFCIILGILYVVMFAAAVIEHKL
jgi:hypothetical protein